jgi:putative Mg2+ transporter-C (MgtC) family protein
MLDWFEIVTRLVAAAAIGGGIGLNRHLHHKATGVRTLGLIACSAAGLVLAALHGADGVLHYDAMSRVIQGILTGLASSAPVDHPRHDRRRCGLTTAAAV